MEQGSIDWLTWREQGIGSSDAPVIMKASPWSTPHQLWEERLGLRPKRDTNWAMQRGIDLEPKARAMYELLSDCDMQPALREHPLYPQIRASFDGLNEEKRRSLEIKCAGREDHQTAIEGRIPEKYIWQVRHQMMVANVDLADYLSFDGERAAIVTIERDMKAERILLDEELKFWDLLQKKIPPELTDKDFKVLKDKASVALFESLRETKLAIESLKEKYESLREQALKDLPAPRVKCAGVIVRQITRKGNVDYGKIEVLKGLDLDSYRKPETKYYEVEIEEV